MKFLMLTFALLISPITHATLLDFTGNSGQIGSSELFNDGFVTVIGSNTLHQDGDGLGVVGAGDSDEINGNEYIRVLFDNPVLVNAIAVDDLWLNTGDVQASFSWDGGSGNIAAIHTSGSNSITTYVPFAGPFLASWLEFSSGVPGDDSRGYALRSIDYDTSPVPVPAAVWLLGSALIGLVGFSRKKESGEPA